MTSELTPLPEYEDFHALIGQTVTVDQGGTSVAMTVRSVERSQRHPGQTRDPFAVILCGPVEPQLEQATYTIDLGKLGRHALFLVPVAGDANGVDYELIFT